MARMFHFVILFVLISLQSAFQYGAQPSGASVGNARALDALLQGYAYNAFTRPRTGISYEGTVPSNLTGIKIEAIRLRTGSLKKRGVKNYEEFSIPAGVVVQPSVQRLALVYQNLGNWSSFYYPLPGYIYLTPVVGLLAYDAANLSAVNLPELDFVASSSTSISIDFSNVALLPSSVIARCVRFDLDGLPEFRSLISPQVCSAYRLGHFSIIASSSEIPPPAPSSKQKPGPIPSGGKSNKSKVVTIVVGVIGGLIVLILLAMIVTCIVRNRHNKKLSRMELQSEAAVGLHMARVGNTQAPVASGMRTQPVLENEYVA